MVSEPQQFEPLTICKGKILWITPTNDALNCMSYPKAIRYYMGQTKNHKGTQYKNIQQNVFRNINTQKFICSEVFSLDAFVVKANHKLHANPFSECVSEHSLQIIPYLSYEYTSALKKPSFILHHYPHNEFIQTFSVISIFLLA